MSRPSRALLVALSLSVACGPPSRPRDPPIGLKPFREPAGSAAQPTGPVPTVHTPRNAVEAPHTGTIQLLAATPDATAVLTLDELGGARLWPSLDGKDEPRVVELPAARDLALGTHAAGFTAIVLDESGGLYIAKLDRSGRTLSHTTHGTDPAFAGVVMSTAGAVAWRTDHHVLLIDTDGKVTDQLATQPQQRIVDIAVAGTRAIAILDKAGTRQPRWLALEPRLAWGDWITPAIEGQVGAAIALAPDHKHIAITVDADKKQRVSIVEAPTGKHVATRDLTTPTEVRFADANLVAIGSPQGLSWMAVAANTPAAPAPTPINAMLRRVQKLAAGGGRVIASNHGELMLLTPTDTQFLGYQAVAPRVAQVAGNGHVMLNTGTTFLLLDPDLRATAKPNMTMQPNTVPSDMIWLGGDDWLVQHPLGTTAGKTQLVLVDVAKDTRTVVRDQLAHSHIVAYEPSTGLATLSFGEAPEVARVDRKRRALDRVGTPRTLSPYEQSVFVPLAPKLARGMQLVVVSLRSKPEVKWLADARALDKPAATVTFDGAFAAADAAGHVYAWRNTNHKLELVIYTDGKQTATLPTVGAASLWPNQTGTRVAEINQHAITVYQTDGKRLWTRELLGAQEALWLTDGALAITHASGVARLDAATGTMTAARCGWEFGLSTKPHPIASRIEPVCMQLLR